MRTKNCSNNNTCYSTLEKEKYDVQKKKKKQTNKQKEIKSTSLSFSQIGQVISFNCFFLRRNFYQLERQEHFTTFSVLGHSYSPIQVVGVHNSCSPH